MDKSLENLTLNKVSVDREVITSSQDRSGQGYISLFLSLVRHVCRQ